MNKKNYFLPLLFLLAFVFVSCDETKEANKYENWQTRNEAFIDSLQKVYDAKNDPPELLYVIDSRNKSQKIFYKKLPGYAPKQGSRSPYLTDKVKVFYRGMLINEGIFSTSLDGYYTTLYEEMKDDTFDQNFTGAKPTEFENPTTFTIATGLIDGWAEVLQHMKPGERWEVYIPWASAYGSQGKSPIPGYSTLIFDLILLEVVVN